MMRRVATATRRPRSRYPGAIGMTIDPRAHLAFPLDVADVREAREWVTKLSPAVGVFKVGLELFTAAGPEAVHIAREGAKCVQDDRRPVHVSGHASEDELKLMLSLVRPRYFVPIHGEYRFLADHARVATELAGDRTEVLLVENGQVVRFSPGPGRIVGSVKVGRTLLDGTRSAEVVEEVLRERQHLAREGVVVPVVTVNRQRAGVVGTPEVITRGMVLDEQVDALLETLPELMRDIVAQEDHDEFPGQDQVAEQVRGELQRVIRKRLGRRPVVLPVIMES